MTLLQSQKPKQAKAILQTLLTEGHQDQVVDYLAAMQERKAAKVLAAFKTPQEVVQATALVEALRQRGMFALPAAAGGVVAAAGEGGST